MGPNDMRSIADHVRGKDAEEVREELDELWDAILEALPDGDDRQEVIQRHLGTKVNEAVYSAQEFGWEGI